MQIREPDSTTPSPAELVKNSLKLQGFPEVGYLDYSLSLEQYREHLSRYESWIARGMHGEMGYLERGLDFRSNPHKLFPDLESVFVVLSSYPTYKIEGDGIRYARYLNGPDYHDVLKTRLNAALISAQEKIPELKFKVCVDTSAVLERTWAALSGLGWIGKNTLLIHPKLGSYVFIGVVFTNLQTGAAPSLQPDYCGRCTRCLDACPTEAILSTHEVDSRKCISYLTLEKRGEFKFAAENLAPNFNGYIAGCDICQEVCPFNTKPVKNETAPPSVANYLVCNLETLQNETEDGYKKRVKDTALSRIKFTDFKRNLNWISQGVARSKKLD